MAVRKPAPKVTAQELLRADAARRARPPQRDPTGEHHNAIAQIAADAAALAAASNNDSVAEVFTELNGGELVSVRRFGDDDEFVEVTVVVDGMRAVAVATDSW